MKTKYLLTSITLSLVLSQATLAQTFDLPWQQVTQVPNKNIFSINNLYNEIFVTEGDTVYYSENAGTTWKTSAALTPPPPASSDIISFNGKLYLATFGKGVFVSSNGGKNWVQLNNGLGSNFGIRFIQRNANLFLATDDNGVYQLNSAGTQWQPFNNGIAGNWSNGFYCLESYSQGLMAGAGQNGYVLYYEDTASTWKGSYLEGAITPGLTVYDLVNTGNYIWAITNSKVYASNNKGLTWARVDAGMQSGFFCKMLQVSTTLYAAVNKNGNCLLYKRNISDPLTTGWILIDTMTGYECYGLSNAFSRLYMATPHGLIYLDTQATSLEENKRESEGFRILPNPCSEEFLLVYNGEEDIDQFVVYNMQGEKIMSPLIGVTKRVDVSILSEGMYVGEMIMANGLSQRKIIIIKR